MRGGVSPPPGLAPQVRPTAGAHGLAMGTVPNPPAALARLASGTIVTGTVIGRDAATGRVTVRTELGSLELTINLSLPVDSRVSLELRNAGGRLLAIVLSVEPPPDAAAKPARAGAAPPQPVTPPPITGGVVTAAVVDPTLLRQLARRPVAPPPASAGPAGGPTGNPAGGNPAVGSPAGANRAVINPAAASPAGTGRAGDSPPPPTSPAPPGQTRGGRIATAAGPPPIAALPMERPVIAGPTMTDSRWAPPAPAAPLPVGAALRLRIVEIAPPTAAGLNPTPLAPPTPMLAGTVAAVTPAGNPVVETARGVLVLDVAAAPLPAGSRIVLDVLPAPEIPAPLLSALDPSQRLVLSWDWPTLAEAVAVLSRGAPGGAATPAALPLPQVGSRLTAGLLTLIAAFGGGDLAGRLGVALAGPLERSGHGDLAGRVRQELVQVAQLATDATGDDWRLLLLPLLNQGELQKAKLYLRRRPRGGDAAERPDGGTRFILEVELTRLGPLQLDGLVQARRFDLMLRSRTPLTPQMQRDIADIFDEARAIGGLAGRVEFAATPTLPTIPLGRGRREGDLLV